MPISVDDLPEILPSPDANICQLRELQIREAAKNSGHFVADKLLCITGHVDSGKSSTTAAMLSYLGVITEKQLKEEENKIIAKKGEDYHASKLEIATRSVEKGKEAKERGMTIEVKAHEMPFKAHAYFEENSENWNEFIRLLGVLEIPYQIEMVKDDKGVERKEITYTSRFILCDAPGHQDYIHNTSAGIGVADIQFALFPSSSGAGEGGEDQFLHALTKGSTSMGHSRLGMSQNNYMVFMLSKTDFNTSNINSERMTTLTQVLAKNLGVKKNKALVIPTSSVDLIPHNVFVPSELECLKFYKGTTVDLSIKDYRNPTRVYPVTADIKLASTLFYYVMPQICVKGTYENKGCLVCITEIASNTKHGVIYIGQVMNGVLSVGDVMTSVQNTECQYRVESMEQFLKSVKHSPVKSFIGMKLKPVSKNKAPVPRHDLLHCDYPADNIPISTQYMEARMLFFPTEKGAKNKEHKIGAEFTMVTAIKETISIVNVYSLKAGKEAEVKDTPDAPITTWPQNNSIVTGVVKFKHKVNIPTTKQAVYGNMGNFLSSKQVTGSIKLMSHLTDGESKDKVLLAGKKKVKKA